MNQGRLWLGGLRLEAPRRLDQHVCLKQIIFQSLPVIPQADDDKEKRSVLIAF